MSDLTNSDILRLLPHLPDQVVTEILTRLPAKSICRFKCVSKAWNSMICHPYFISSYIAARSSPSSWFIFDQLIRVNPESDPEFTLQLHQPLDISTLTVNAPKIADESTEFLNNHKFPAMLLTSSSGLVLFSIMVKRDPQKEWTASHLSWISEQDSLFVANPVTLEWVSIPKPPCYITGQSSVGFTAKVGPTGVLERFRIVEYQPILGSEVATMMFFSSETGKWEKKLVKHALGLHMWRFHVTLEYDGHLLWVDERIAIISCDDPFTGDYRVECRCISLPTISFDDSGEERRCVDVGGGYLQFLEVSKGGSEELSLWRLVDYVFEEWSCVYKLCLADVWADDSYLGCGLEKVVPTPYLMDPNECDVVIFRVDDRLFSLNVCTRKVVSCGCSGLDEYACLTIVKVPSWPTLFTLSMKATFLKEQGNSDFKAKDFNEAITCYSRSIALSPNVLAYANRAMAYLKVGKYHEAEVDCTEALKLDGEYFKAYGRRAIARKELGDLEGCVEDLEFALKLKPDDQEMQKGLYAEVKALIEQVKPSGPMPTAPPAQNDPSIQESGCEGELAHDGAA